MSEHYAENVDEGAKYREKYLHQVESLIVERQGQANAQRRQSLAPDWTSVDSYAAGLARYRQSFRGMLGFPLTNTPSGPVVPESRMHWVARDPLGDIWRVHVEALPGYEVYGLLFLPAHPGPHRLVIAHLPVPPRVGEPT